MGHFLHSVVGKGSTSGSTNSASSVTLVLVEVDGNDCLKICQKMSAIKTGPAKSPHSNKKTTRIKDYWQFWSREVSKRETRKNYSCSRNRKRNHKKLGLFGQLTCLLLRSDSSSVSMTVLAISIVGIASLLSLFLIPSSLATSFRMLKQLSSKWTEQRIDDLVGDQLGLCLRTKETHFKYREASRSLFGKVWIDIPSVNCLFLQLLPPGPPATQDLPPRLAEDFVFSLEEAILNTIYFLVDHNCDVTPKSNFSRQNSSKQRLWSAVTL